MLLEQLVLRGGRGFGHHARAELGDGQFVALLSAPTLAPTGAGRYRGEVGRGAGGCQRRHGAGASTRGGAAVRPDTVTTTTTALRVATHRVGRRWVVAGGRNIGELLLLLLEQVIDAVLLSLFLPGLCRHWRYSRHPHGTQRLAHTHDDVENGGDHNGNPSSLWKSRWREIAQLPCCPTCAC